MADGSEGAPAAEALARLAQQALAPIALARPFLERWPAPGATRPVMPCRLPVVAHLGFGHHARSDLASSALSALVELLIKRADALEWRQTYTAADFGPDFIDGYGWSEFIGLRGPIPSTDIACGVLLLGPGIDYPPHAHEAEEFYLPLAGTALWRRGEADFIPRAPGEPIHHPAWMPHAMRTLSEPMLALYVWRGGDLAAKSRIIADYTNGGHI